MRYENGSISLLPLFFIIAFVALIDGTDGSIVNIALPVLAESLGTDTGTIAWVTVTYFMMIAGTVLLFAKIASNGSVKKVLIGGMLLFTISSVLCALSNSLALLAIARIVQGTGAAMMGASTPIICVRYLPPNRLATGLGIITLGSALGYSVGPALGGFILSALSWHWVFLINIPIAAVILPIMFRYVPKDTEQTKEPVDLAGALTFLAAIVLGLYALESYGRPGTTTGALVSAALCLITLALFSVIELRKKRPLLNVRAFKHWEFVFVFISFMMVNLTYMGVLYLFPFYFDINVGFDSLTTGLYLLILSVVTLIIVIPMSSMSDKRGKRPFSIASCLCITASAAICYYAVPDNNIPLIVIALILLGITWSLCGGAMASRIIDKISEETREMGSSLMTIAIYVGCAVGTALYAMMFILYTKSGDINFSDLPPETFLSGFLFTLAVTVVLCAMTVIMSAAVRDKD